MRKISDPELILKVALSMTKGVTCDVVRQMPQAGVEPRDFFELSAPELSNAMGFAPGFSIDEHARDEAIFSARREMEFMQKHHIKALFLNDDDYPWRMSDIPHAPIVVFQLGDCDLNVEHPVSVVGTRRMTAYGMDFCRRLVADLAGYFSDLVVVSGLAYGTDATAHEAALNSGVKTIGVLAHGLNTIYPAAHRDLAKRIIKSGGALISEYPSGSAPYKQRFLERNRIVAAVSDAVVVVESEVRGGAMSTANHAFQNNRDVFALPGRISDPMSAGCNHLIRRDKAHLITCAADLIEISGWQPLGLNISPGMRSLFPELTGDGKAVYDYLRLESDARTLDSIHQYTRIPMSTLMGVLADLEFEGIVMRHPGNRFSV